MGCFSLLFRTCLEFHKFSLLATDVFQNYKIHQFIIQAFQSSPIIFAGSKQWYRAYVRYGRNADSLSPNDVALLHVLHEFSMTWYWQKIAFSFLLANGKVHWHPAFKQPNFQGLLVSKIVENIVK